MGIRRSSARIAFSFEIDLLMYSTFAVHRGESARQKRLALVLSTARGGRNRAAIHLKNDDSGTNPPSSERLGRTRPEDRRDRGYRRCVNKPFAHGLILRSLLGLR